MATNGELGNPERDFLAVLRVEKHDNAVARVGVETGQAAHSLSELRELKSRTIGGALNLDVDTETLAATLDARSRSADDPFGRDFSAAPPLEPPYYAVKVTGALFHTQGGLRIDERARVLRRSGAPLPNLFAGGGAACGVSGPDVSGYLSGNGLLTAIAFGWLAGDAAREV